jgi:hypothetical protein
MNAPASQMDAAVAVTRRRIEEASTPRDRLRVIWAGAKLAINVADVEVVKKRFTALGHEFGGKLGRHAAEDLRQVIDWACRGLDPWGCA